MRHPALLALGAGAIVLLVALATPLLHMGRAEPPAAPDAELPWRAQPLADGQLGVFGLVLGRDKLTQAQSRWGDTLQLALVAKLGEVGALEALVDPFSAGFVSGRLVLSFDVPAPTLQRWRENAVKSEPMEGGVRRFLLRSEDVADAASARISGLSFVPGVKLSEADVRQRFGAPAEALSQPGGARVLLYPALGLTVAVAETGATRSVMEYVTPKEFEQRLRAPLAASSAR
jgi:hypothetical protein